MQNLRLNRKGQFSIIAAMLVAVVLVGAVITTYSSIRYSALSDQPQTLSSIDEVNLALKNILGFTVGYYGSVLQVTGNYSYARMLASNYLSSGLDNIADIRPELSPSFNISYLDLRTNWFSNTSYSSGNFTIKYDLGGLGIYGMTYSTSTRLDVQVLSSSNMNQALLNISSDGEPLVNLGQTNFKFYKYIFSNSTWIFVGPTSEPTTYMDGRYLIDLPSGMNASYVIQVEDTRGLMVVASSFNRITSTLTWNTTSVEQGFHYVDNANSNVDSVAGIGSHSNFTAQQYGPDNINDTITEGASPEVPNYALDLEEQWVNVNFTNTRQDLCIRTGSLGAEPLKVDVWYGGSWHNVLTLVSGWNNVSLTPYIDSSTLNLTIRFIGSNDVADPIQDSWNIDAAFIKPQPDISYLVNLQDSTFTVEVLQNGTMRWLKQNLQLTTQELPIPPIPVKDIHVNETINGVNQEVPFQIEDWASNYQIPLGLTGNATVFGNRQMIVFLLNNKVSDFTIWWNGSDTAVQTPNAFTNKYFTADNTASGTLSNGKVTLQFGGFNVKSTVAGTSTSSTAYFMRINQQNSTYGAGLAYVIHHGVVRDIVQQEAEWNNGAAGCPNLYANIVLTLPANVTYYTYQLRIMFINSTQTRTITDLCPIELITSLSPIQTQTENGTIGGFPTVQNGTGTFSNYTSAGNWTAHHWSQFITDAGTQGAGIMFSDSANQNLYAFDSIAGAHTGALNVTGTSLIELLPVKLASASFTYPLDITWSGAVATFDGSTPICSMLGTTPTGLWILAEHPPTLTVTAKR